MPRSKFILLLMIVLVLGAGVVVGRMWAKLPVINPPSDEHPSWVAKELHLSPDQRKQMDGIWAVTRQKMSGTFEQRRNLDKQRDQEIVALLSVEQKAKYDKIQNDFHQQRSDLEKERVSLVKDAEEKSRALLDEDQKKLWDNMPRPPHDHGPRGASSTGPSTRPFRPHGDHPHDGF